MDVSLINPFKRRARLFLLTEKILTPLSETVLLEEEGRVFIFPGAPLSL